MLRGRTPTANPHHNRIPTFVVNGEGISPTVSPIPTAALPGSIIIDQRIFTGNDIADAIFKEVQFGGHLNLREDGVCLDLMSHYNSRPA